MTPVQQVGPGTAVCSRCKTEEAVVNTRKENFCRRCFVRFIRGKQRKQMQHDRFKVRYGDVADRYGRQKVLVAVLGGESSLVMLDTVGSMLQEQVEAHKGRQAFEMVVVVIDERNGAVDMVRSVLGRYAPVRVSVVHVDPETYFAGAHLDTVVMDRKFHVVAAGPAGPRLLETVLGELPKLSAEDLLTVVYEHIVLDTAVAEQCSTIVYGHSMTRIANEVIALTVKGRGSTVHEAVADHEVTHHGVPIGVIFPLREVLQAEVAAYARLCGLDDSVVQSKLVSRITKNMTVRDITTQYFRDLDASGYASTASTVVKTGEKLAAPKGPVAGQCHICGTAIHLDPKQWLQRITVSESVGLDTDDERAYAAEYEAHFGRDEPAAGKPLAVCYGCTVSLGGARDFAWKQSVVDEYSLE